MMVLLVSEVREETVQPHESLGGEHKEVGLPPTGALLRKVQQTHCSETAGRELTTTPLHCAQKITLFVLKGQYSVQITSTIVF